MTDDELIERVRGRMILASQGIGSKGPTLEEWDRIAAAAIATVREAGADEIDRLRKMVEAAFVEGFGYGKIATSPMHVMGAWHLSKARAELQETDR